jgi:hypothetical protein
MRRMTWLPLSETNSDFVIGSYTTSHGEFHRACELAPSAYPPGAGAGIMLTIHEHVIEQL